MDSVVPITITAEVKEYIKILIETSKLLFSNLIKVNPITGNNLF